MKIFHTSDWHLGKSLEGRSRLEEQEMFLKDFCMDVEEENPDIIIISGDIYDTVNPPTYAEKLYFDTVKKISGNGKRLVVVIAGNHDSPDKLEAGKNVLEEIGVYVFGLPSTTSNTGVFDGFEVVYTDTGFMKINKDGETVNIGILPYPSEKRLGYQLDYSKSDFELRLEYSEIIKERLDRIAENFRDDEINIITSHLFVLGSDSSDSERSIQLGGSFLVDKEILPEKADYIALGHMHREQKVSGKTNCYYSGSPLQYSKSEQKHAKFYNICTFTKGENGYEVDIEKKPIRNYRPIEEIKTSSIDEALKKSEEFGNRKVWAYFEIHTDRIIQQGEIKEIKKNVDEVIEIKPVTEKISKDNVPDDINKLDDIELFERFYKSMRDVKPDKNIMALYKRLMSEEDEDEADKH